MHGEQVTRNLNGSNGAVMFKTSQPSPERSNDDRGGEKGNSSRAKFKSFEDFSAWMDEQLIKLEASQSRFVTSESVRTFFNHR